MHTYTHSHLELKPEEEKLQKKIQMASDGDALRRAQQYTLTHTNSHWDVAPEKVTHERINPNDISLRRAQLCTNTHSHTQILVLGCGTPERKKTSNEIRRIAVQKEGHSCTHSHTQTFVLECGTSKRKINKRMQPIDIKWMMVQKKGTSMCTRTHTYKHVHWDVTQGEETQASAPEWHK